MSLFAQTAVPTPEAIREIAEEVISRPHFQIESMPSEDSPLWWEVLTWILKPFIWLFRSLDGLPDVLRWLIFLGCIVLLALIVAHMIFTLVAAIRPPRSSSRALPYQAAPDVVPDDLEKEATACEVNGDYIGAIRLLFRAALRRIELVEQRRFRPGFTNRELLRRYRDTPLANSLEKFVETLDHKWYGDAPCEPKDLLSCRNEHNKICLHLQGGARLAPGA